MIRIYDTWASWRIEIGFKRWRLTVDYWYLYKRHVTVQWHSSIGTVEL